MKFWLPLAVLVVLSNCLDASRIVCYFESWATYRTGSGKFDVENIDPNLCTHIIYAFLNINSNAQVVPFDSWNDINMGALQRFNNLKTKNPNLKTLAAIGGASADSNTFSQVINNSTSRAQLANNIVSFALQYNFNGIDLDWEYPTDKNAFTALLQLLRTQFNANGLILSAAVSAGIDTIAASYNVPSLGQYLDFINVMAYDLHGSWDSVTGENSPLYAGPADTSYYQQELNVNAAIQYWIQQGAPALKLNLGIGTYGRSFTLQNANNNGVGAPTTGGGNAGPYTQSAGFLGYYEICQACVAGQLQEQWNTAQSTAYAYQSNQWVGYDNVQAVKIKAQYSTTNGLGGLMFWALDTDDFSNTCGYGVFPLINAAKTYLG